MVRSEIIQMYKNLKKIYEKNKDDPEKIVMYEDQEILIGYLKYYLENLENKYNFIKEIK